MDSTDPQAHQQRQPQQSHIQQQHQPPQHPHAPPQAQPPQTDYPGAMSYPYYRNPYPASPHFPPNIGYASPYHHQYGHYQWTHSQPATNYTAPTVPTNQAGQPAAASPQHAPPTPRPRRVATLKDPDTGAKIDLKPVARTKSTAPKVSPSLATASPTTNSTNTTANTANATSSSPNATQSPNSPSVSNILLQKVSEDPVAIATVTTTAAANTQTTVATTVAPIASAVKVATPATTTSATTVPSATATTTTKTTVSSPTNAATTETKATTPASLTTTTVTTTTTTTTTTATEATKTFAAASPPPSATTTTTPNTNQQASPEPKKEEVKISEVKNAVIPEETHNEKVNGNNGDTKEGDHEDGSHNTQDNEDKKPEDEASEDSSLPYEPGQYHPIKNTDGRRVYSREFLLAVKKTCHFETSPEQIQLSDSTDKFLPIFMQVGPNRHYQPRRSGEQEKVKRKIATSSLTPEVGLHTVSNPWKPTKEKKEVNSDEVDSGTEELKKKFRSILNKLTPNNFESLSTSVTSLNIDTEEKLSDVIDIVFAKALSEPGYCVLYGQMCSHLKKTSAGTANFGNTLLRRCQLQFNSDIYTGLDVEGRRAKIEEEKDPEVKKQLDEELYEDMYRCRMRGLGLIKFIGELYKIDMLNYNIMLECISRLLQEGSEESLECLCDLLITIGENLDRATKAQNALGRNQHPKNKSYGQRTAASVVASAPTTAADSTPTLDTVFGELHKIRKNRKDLSARIKFKLLDVCDLREKENWQSKRTKDNNPKRIEEIREEQKEKLETERKQNLISRRSQEGRRGGLGHSGGSSNQLSSMGGESGGRGSGPNMHASSSSYSIRDHSNSDNNVKSTPNNIDTSKDHQRAKDLVATLSLSVKSDAASHSFRPVTKTVKKAT